MNFRLFRGPAALAFGAMLLASFVSAQAPQATEQTPYGGTVVESIIARVNNQIITSSDYSRALKELEQEDQQRDVSMQQQSLDRKNLLRNLIDQQLWLSKGKELGITGDTELVKRLDAIRKQYHLASLDDLRKAAREQGVSYEDFKANIRNQIITQQVMRQEVGANIQITPGEARRYYEEHKDEYKQPESVHLSEILISTGTDGASDSEKVAAAKAKAEDIEAKLHAGGDFGQLARTFSDGPTAAGGGDLGTYKRGQLPKVLEDKTFPLKVGQWTQPILTRQGWIILKMDQHTPAGVAPFKSVENNVENALFMSKMEPAIQAYLKKMRNEASIFIAPGYTDVGATEAELNPSITFSAYAPPAPKKKKHVERTRFRETGRSRQSSNEETAAKKATKEKKRNKKEQAAIEKPGKKEKIRFGQSPRETLPPASADESTKPAIENAGALPESEYNTNAAVNPLAQAPSHKGKWRYSDLAKERKHNKKDNKKEKKADSFAATPPTPAEVADREMQSTSLGLGGKATDKKKEKKRGTKEQKTRFSQEKKKPERPPVFTPAPPVQGAPAPGNTPKAEPSSTTSTPQQ